ncbi:hypothetical protein LCGC14_0797890 [marine sediment metagenome]|uniref:Uncharacterized protein n=1 Tax=marine sediment metagenome TaxID=412755 RepID=A0A0F9SXT0_9ZZZZ|nr:hypothetical protein [bacterium]
MLRVKACLACKKYINICTSNYEDNEKLKKFEHKHKLHTTQTILKSELKPRNKFDTIYIEAD